MTPIKNYYTLSLAAGLSVYTPVVVVDGETLVLLQMLGAPEAVNANWAALVGGGKAHWIKGELIQLGGMKHHIRLKAALPCGWSETWLIHRQASFAEMTPGQPFYVIDDGLALPVTKFFWLCDKSFSIPLQATWAEHLWLAGQERGLVTLVNPDSCHGLTAWRVDPDLSAWEEIVSTGLQQRQITF